jgi:hypothetical protein
MDFAVPKWWDMNYNGQIIYSMYSPAIALHQNQFPGSCKSYLAYPLDQKCTEDFLNVGEVNQRRIL